MTLKSKLKKNKVYIIAEIGVNHNGKIDIAKKLIDCAKKCGADAVKLQNFITENLATKDAKKAPYQSKNMPIKETQFKMLKKFELKFNEYFLLKKYALKKKIDLISSPFDEKSLDFLSLKLKLNTVKIPSGEINNIFLLKKLNPNKYNIILSTGMSNLKEIVDAINLICKKRVLIFKSNNNIILSLNNFKIFKNKIYILHCVTDYPVEEKYANLNAISTLQKKLNFITGYSDHTKNIIAPLIAVSKGARIIEKHLTLNNNMIGPDHKASLSPKDFSNMVNLIRRYEIMAGDGIKIPQICEKKNILIARKSLVAKTKILKGETFTMQNITAKRPGKGIPPNKIDFILGKRAKKNYLEDELIK